jgi:hypothetical protein
MASAAIEERKEQTIMPSLEALVHQRVALKARRDGALTALCARAGVAVPAIPHAGRPKPMGQWMNHDLEADTTLAELLGGLAGEVDELRAEIDALTGAKKGAKR